MSFFSSVYTIGCLGYYYSIFCWDFPGADRSFAGEAEGSNFLIEPSSAVLMMSQQVMQQPAFPQETLAQAVQQRASFERDVLHSVPQQAL